MQRIAGAVVPLLAALTLFPAPAVATDLKVMKQGLGSGTVTSSPAGIDCGSDCDQAFTTAVTVTLTATPAARWEGDCSGTSNTCTVTMGADRSVRAVFSLLPAIPTLSDCSSAPGNDCSPEEIQDYLDANPTVNTAARFVKALPTEYKWNWILMSRSESLQTGTAEFPRLLLPSADARFVFTLGLATHGSYPGAHPNAIEYMQWDAAEKNFRFHEIVLDAIPEMDPDGDGAGVIPARTRQVYVDDVKCSKCHSTRNVLSLDRSVSPPVPGAIGTDGIRPGTVKAKNKPNWDAYDSWGGMMPFNRDRIYEGSVEAAVFRKIFNVWNWRTNDGVRAVIEQLELQPPGVPAGDAITRASGGTNDGHVNFAFDASPPVLSEPAASSSDSASITYSFDGLAGTPPGTDVARGGSYVTLRHSSDVTSTALDLEGRGVQLFDLLGGFDGSLNQRRVADELISHRWATGSFPIDVRPIALAITERCLSVDEPANTVTSSPPLTIDLGFFDARNGISINQLVQDTETRAFSLPRRKADIEKLVLDRRGDVYLSGPEDGLIQEYGAATSAGASPTMGRLRQEVFRRPVDLGFSDRTVMGGVYVDRELEPNIEKIALYRYFLEPLGVSVDKWSMGVRGRSRTYTFADIFGTYENVLVSELQSSLTSEPVAGLAAPYECPELIAAVNSSLSSLPPVDDIPKYTDIQRIFNKSCIECHGGLDYPPYGNYGSFLDLSEDEDPPAGDDRLDRSHGIVTSAYVTPDPATSFLYQRITATGEDCPYGLMPCGGPPLSKTDIETVRRWIVGGAPNTRGDPHIKTVDGVNYDFQAAGEFVLLRGQNFEIQARQTAVPTDVPLGPNPHTGLRSCVSVNTAAALRVGAHRITYQPNLSGEPDPEGLQLRIDGEPRQMTGEGILLESGGRVIQTTAPGGIQIEAPGGPVVAITPGWWSRYELWYLNIDARHVRATEGVMGVIPPGNWLPALPDGTHMGPRPDSLDQRYSDLYKRFGTAWRVTDETALFDYAPGTSTGTFTIENWPLGESPESCPLQRFPDGRPAPPPLAALPLNVAEEHCSAIVADDARANCVQDVMVTGEPVFAETYLLGEAIERNARPDPPVLVFPESFQIDLAAPVEFTWDKTSDGEDDPVTYRHCVWEVTERYTLSNCEALSSWTVFWGGGTLYAVLAALLGCLLFALLIFLGMRRRPALLALVAVAIVAGVILAYYLGGGPTVSRTIAGLEPGKAYYWKVIAEDGKGGTVESETRRFEIASL